MYKDENNTHLSKQDNIPQRTSHTQLFFKRAIYKCSNIAKMIIDHSINCDKHADYINWSKKRVTGHHQSTRCQIFHIFSQGNLATCSRCGGIVNDKFITNLRLLLTVKEF